MMTDKKATPGKPGRPSGFDKLNLDQVRMLALKGWTDREMADFFSVTEQTWNNWKNAHPAFFESLKDWKAEADHKVEQSLYQRAIGMKVREVRLTGGGDDDEAPAAVETVKELPPDTTAMIFWLKNRKRDQWRDRVDNEHTGKDGGPVQFVIATGVPRADRDD
jgi:hypothetical protein